MNTFLFLLVVSAAPVMLKVIFWVLLLLCALGGFVWRENAVWVRGNSIVLVILLAILGYYTFGF